MRKKNLKAKRKIPRLPSLPKGEEYMEEQLESKNNCLILDMLSFMCQLYIQGKMLSGKVYIRLELREEIQAGDIHLGVTGISVIFRAMRLDEIAKK